MRINSSSLVKSISMRPPPRLANDPDTRAELHLQLVFRGASVHVGAGAAFAWRGVGAPISRPSSADLTSASVSRTERPRVFTSRAAWSCTASAGRRKQRPRVTHRERRRGDVVLDFGRQLEQPERVRDGRAILADRRGHRVLRQVEFVDETAIRFRLVDRVEVFALNVLDQRELEQRLRRLLGADVLEDHGDAREPRALRGAPSTLTGDDPESIARSCARRWAG